MEFKDYYKSELNTLRIEGFEFSKKNPGLSSFLSKPGQDPDVERLLEGFAFLTGKLRQQLDQELPEVAHTLVQLLWPNYVRPVPSYCIIQYQPLRNSTENAFVKKNSYVLSGSDKFQIPCKFRTTYDTTVMPLEITDVEYFHTSKYSTLVLFFDMTARGTLNDINFNVIRVFLSGSKYISDDIYMLMVAYIQSIEISILDENDNVLKNIQISKESIKQVGFSNTEHQVPYPTTVFDGYILLQEYFSFPDKFLFLDIENLGVINNIDKEILQKSKKFSIEFNFSSRLRSIEAPSIDNFLLYCTPIVNIFETDAVPIRKEKTTDEYLIVPSELPAEQVEVFSVENVRGWMATKETYADYELFESFSNIDESEYYSLRVKFSDLHGGTNTYLRFASTDGLYQDYENSTATVSVKILCTNKNKPNELLLGDINVVDSLSTMQNLKFENITIPSPSYAPPIQGDFLWKILSNMSLNFLSLDNVNVMKSIIQTYDFVGANDANAKEKTSIMLSGIKSISYEFAQMLYEGLPIKGIKSNIKIDAQKFDSMGEIYIFMSVMNEFLSLYGHVNSFHQLEVDVENEDTFQWKHKIGSRTLI